MKTQKIKSLRYLLVLPIFAMFMMEYSCSRETEVNTEQELLNKNIEGGVYNFNVVEIQPQVKGVDETFTKEEKYLELQKLIMKHVKDNFQYPEEAKLNGIQGRVITQFIIGVDGKVNDVKVVRGVDELLDAEAKRIAKTIPDLDPAYNNGKAVPVSFMLPITFKLSDDENVNSDIEPSPIAYINGEKFTMAKIEELRTEDIKSMNVLKGEAAITKYGDEAKEGVIEVTLREGVKIPN